MSNYNLYNRAHLRVLLLPCLVVTLCCILLAQCIRFLGYLFGKIPQKSQSLVKHIFKKSLYILGISIILLICFDPNIPPNVRLPFLRNTILGVPLILAFLFLQYTNGLAWTFALCSPNRLWLLLGGLMGGIIVSIPMLYFNPLLVIYGSFPLGAAAGIRLVRNYYKRKR